MASLGLRDRPANAQPARNFAFAQSFSCQCSDLGDVLRNTGRSPVRAPFFARLSDAGLDAVAQYVVFELSEDCQHPCQGPPTWRGQIESFAQGDEADID
jgi:hypothetical protein